MRQWLKAGFVYRQVAYPTNEGTPQGGIASPVLTNMTLDGLEAALWEKLLTHIEQGFDSLGQTIRKYDGKFLTRPAKGSTKAFMEKIRTTIKRNRHLTAGQLIAVLNPKIRGWANYHRHAASKKTFTRLGQLIREAIWRWARRKHPNKLVKLMRCGFIVRPLARRTREMTKQLQADSYFGFAEEAMWGAVVGRVAKSVSFWHAASSSEIGDHTMEQIIPIEEIVELTSEAIFERYRDRIYRYILGMVHDPAEAEDLTQETFLRVHRKLKSLRDQNAVASWLYRIATHVCYDRFRQASYRDVPQPFDTAPDDEDSETQWSDPEAPHLEQITEQTEMSVCVQEYIAELSDNYRTAIILHDIHRLTNPEIARMLNISLGAVKIRLHRARQRLKTALKAGCDFNRDERDVLVCEPKLPDP